VKKVQNNFTETFWTGTCNTIYNNFTKLFFQRDVLRINCVMYLSKKRNRVVTEIDFGMQWNIYLNSDHESVTPFFSI